MLDVVVFLVSVLVVGGLLFLVGSLLLGRGETQPPADPDRSPVELPGDRPVAADDVRALRLSVTVRGYRMSEVDWVLEQLARAIAERDERIAALGSGRKDADRGPTPAEQPDGRDSLPPPRGSTPQGSPAGGNGAQADA